MKKNIFRTLSVVVAAAAVLTGCASKNSANGRTVEQIKKSGKVVIAVFSDKKPFGYVDENGLYRGYDVYFGDRIAKDLGVKVEYVPVEAASRVEVLATGKVDIVLANFTRTPERAEKVDFALPYMKVALGVVSPEAALIEKPEDLFGKKLIISKGTTAETYFTKNYPEVELLKFDQYSEAYNALVDGRGAAMSPAVQKGNKSLLDWINNEIVSLAEEKFFHADYEETLRPVYGAAADADNLVVEGGQM